MRTCPQCGNTLPADAIYCPGDGACVLLPNEIGTLSGQRLDERYFLEALIGSGGLGEVYRARHMRMGRYFAIKVLQGSELDNESFRRRFEREARVMSRLRHPYCVEVTDHGQTEVGPYIVMELLDGEPLSIYTKGRGLPLGAALSLIVKVLEGLEHAHAQGIVHRDVKPDNIMLVRNAKDGAVDPKLLDFGLAKMQAGAIDAEALTAPGTVVGTPAYLAPERVVAATSSSVQPAIDIYAVGVILYELCCGRRPFASDDTATLVRLHLTAQPTAPRQLRPELAPALENAILRALAKLPSMRFSSAAAFREALIAAPPPSAALAECRPPLQAG